MFCGYHNHTHEFGASGDGDKTWWDLLAERTRNEVVLQMDVGHLTRAGRDPVAYLKKYPGRTRTAHISPAVVRDGKDVMRSSARTRCHGKKSSPPVAKSAAPNGLSSSRKTTCPARRRWNARSFP